MLKYTVIILSSLLVGCQTIGPGVPQTSVGERPPQLSAGLTHLYFSEWDGPTIPLWVYVPKNIDPRSAPIMFMMHGAKRGAARYLSEWDSVADEGGFIVVAPEFNKADFPGSRHYNLGNMYPTDERSRNPEPMWTFSAIVPSFEFVRTQLNGTQATFSLYGHSAGSQFIHRFMYFKPEAPVSRFLPANAGWYTFPNLEIAYPYGLGGTGLSEADLKSVLEKDVVVLLGDADNDSSHESLRRSDEAMAQGPHRFARGLEFYEAAQAAAEQLGADFGWQIRIVNDVAHSNAGIASDVGDLIE